MTESELRLQEQIISLQGKVEELQTAYDAAHSELARMTAQLGACRGVAEELTKASAFDHSEYKRLRDELKEQLAAMTQERDELERLYGSEFNANNELIGVRKELHDSLTASQSREAALRAALKSLLPVNYCTNSHGEKFAMHKGDPLAVQNAEKILALPSDTTALDRSNKLYAAGVLKELSAGAFTHQRSFDLRLLDKAAQLRKEAEK